MLRDLFQRLPGSILTAAAMILPAVIPHHASGQVLEAVLKNLNGDRKNVEFVELFQGTPEEEAFRSLLKKEDACTKYFDPVYPTSPPGKVSWAPVQGFRLSIKSLGAQPGDVVRMRSSDGKSYQVFVYVEEKVPDWPVKKSATADFFAYPYLNRLKDKDQRLKHMEYNTFPPHFHRGFAAYLYAQIHAQMNWLDRLLAWLKEFFSSEDALSYTSGSGKYQIEWLTTDISQKAKKAVYRQYYYNSKFWKPGAKFQVLRLASKPADNLALVFRSDETGGKFLLPFERTDGETTAPDNRFRFLIGQGRKIRFRLVKWIVDASSPEGRGDAVDLTQYNLTFKIENLGGGVPPNERDFPADKTEGELKQSEIEFTPIANNENRKQLAGSGGQNPVIAGCRHAIPPVSYRVHIKKSGDVKDMVTATIAQDLKDRLRQEYVDCAMVRGGEFNAAGHLPARVDIKVPESIPNPNFSSGGQPFWFHSRELAGVNPNPDPGSQPTIATANHAHGAGEHPHYFSPMPQDGEYLGLAWDNGFREVTRAMRTATNFPLSFNCGYRSPTHNNCVGGARFSRHLWGRAADLAPALQGQHGSTWVQRILVLYNASRDAGYQTILEYGGTPLLRFVPTAWAIPAAGAHVAWTSGTQHGTVELRDIAQPHDAFPEAFVQVTGGPPPENAEADIDGERIRFRQGGWELRFNGNWIDVHQQLLHATHVHVARQ